MNRHQSGKKGKGGKKEKNEGNDFFESRRILFPPLQLTLRATRRRCYFRVADRMIVVFTTASVFFGNPIHQCIRIQATKKVGAFLYCGSGEAFFRSWYALCGSNDSASAVLRNIRSRHSRQLASKTILLCLLCSFFPVGLSPENFPSQRYGQD